MLREFLNMIELGAGAPINSDIWKIDGKIGKWSYYLNTYAGKKLSTKENFENEMIRGAIRWAKRKGLMTVGGTLIGDDGAWAGSGVQKADIFAE